MERKRPAALAGPRVSTGLGVAPALLLFLAAPLPAGPGVIVVDDDGGPGVDFTSISAAVAAAADGDTILVKPGSYAAFLVLGKGVEIVASQTDAAQVAGVTVRQVPAGSHVLLHGLHVQSFAEDAISVLNCAGDVTLESCFARGANGVGIYLAPDYHPDGYPGIRVVNATASVLGCTAIGGAGADYALLLSTWGPGGPGLRVASGAAVVHGGHLTGGDGGSVWDDDSAYDGADGGHGIEVSAASVYVSGAGLVGGAGGVGGEDVDGFTGIFSCGDGGDGGSGVGQEGTGVVDVVVLDIQVTPGIGGLGDLGYGGCPSGATGSTTFVYAGTVTTIPEEALHLRIPGPVAENGVLGLELDGPAGAPCVLGVAAAPAHVELPAFLGPLLIDPLAVQTVPLGVLPGGPFLLTFPLSLDLPAGTALLLSAQAVYVSPTSGAIVPGAASTAVVLDSGL